MLDVLVQGDGPTYEIRDTDEFERAYSNGQFGPAWFKAAKREMAGLAQLLEQGKFADMLTQAAPFPRETRLFRPQPPIRTTNQAEFQFHPQYPRHG